MEIANWEAAHQGVRRTLPASPHAVAGWCWVAAERWVCRDCADREEDGDQREASEVRPEKFGHRRNRRQEGRVADSGRATRSSAGRRTPRRRAEAVGARSRRLAEGP